MSAVVKFQDVVYFYGKPFIFSEDKKFLISLPRGRFFGSGRYGEVCLPMRVPVSLVAKVRQLMEEQAAAVAEIRPSAEDPFFTSPGIKELIESGKVSLGGSLND